MSTPIAIIGAGLSGLTLASCLKHKGIGAVVYDRATATAASNRYNYGITLHPSTYRPLLTILQIDETSFREKVAVDAYIGGAGSLSGTNKFTQADGFRCHRGRLETLLRTELHIQWSKSLKDVHISTQSNSVNAMFEDGSHIKTKCLVGCDGPHSTIRQSLSSQMKLEVLTYVAINGKRRIPRDEYDQNIRDHTHGICLLQTKSGDALLQISLDNFTESRVDLSYTYSRPARTGSSDPLYKPDRSVSDANDIPKEFFEELAALSSNLKPPFRQIFDAEKVRSDRLLHWLMRKLVPDMDEVTRLARDGVVLIGDSVHATPIIGGEGANVAIQDGLALAEHIAAHGTEMLEDFSRSRFDGWRASVVDSQKRIEELHLSTTSHL